MGRADGWSVTGLKDRCRRLRDACTGQQVATDEELTAYWPGGSENPETGLGAWIYCYANLVRFLGRGEHLGPAPNADTAALHRAALEALRGTPVRVELVHRGEDGQAVEVFVHPKSFDALVFCEELDANLRWMRDRVLWLREREDAESLQATTALWREITEHHHVLCALVCHPGPGAPWPLTTMPAREVLPAWVLTLDPFDVVAIVAAHLEVNGHRLRQVCQLVSPAPEDGRPPAWSTLALAGATATGAPVESLFRDRSLVSWVAELMLRTEEQRKAAAAAKVA
jgi:hypothetical protein